MGSEIGRSPTPEDIVTNGHVIPALVYTHEGLNVH